MKNFIPFGLLLLAGCVSQPSLKESLLDSASARPRPMAFTLPEIRLGGLRYIADRAREREVLAWHFLSDGELKRGAPMQDEPSALYVKMKVYEVAVVESGRFKGQTLERWDLSAEDSVNPVSRQAHFYFLRSPEQLTHLPAMAKGKSGGELFPKGERGRKLIAFLEDRWNIRLRSESRFRIPELMGPQQMQIPGEGRFSAAPTGESIQLTNERWGEPVELVSLPQGRQIYRIPGDWMVCVYPDGLAVPLKKE